MNQDNVIYLSICGLSVIYFLYNCYSSCKINNNLISLKKSIDDLDLLLKEYFKISSYVSINLKDADCISRH